MQPEFRAYGRRIVENSRAIAQAFVENSQTVVSGGTDNHLVLLDVRPFGITGRQAESAVRECGITLNRNTIPFDPNGPWYTSGLRLGTPAVTTLGMGPEEMKEIASVMTLVLSKTKADITDKGPSKAKYSLDEGVRLEARGRVERVLGRYPVYPELDLDLIQDFVAHASGALA